MNFDDFLEACKDADLARVQRGIAHVDLRQTNSRGLTPLIMAASQGHEEVVELLTPGSDPLQAEQNGWTALMWAARKGRVKAVKLLIPGSDLQQSGRWGNTALMCAAETGRAEAVKLLIPGSNVGQAGNYGRTALILAAEAGYTDVVRILIPGSDLSQKDDAGKTALETAISSRYWPCVDELAMHDQQWEKMQWPEAAGREDLPQWFARLERRDLEGETVSTGRPVASPAKPRNLRL